MNHIPKKYDVLKEVIEYRDGSPYWLVNRGTRAKAGTIAGSISIKGYRIIGCRINGKSHHVRSSRLSFYIHNGYLPEMPLVVDHINQIKTDDRPENLRSATLSQNGRNCSKKQNASSKYKGVSYHQATKKWQVRINFDFGENYIGVFNNERDAARIWDLKTTEYGFDKCTPLNFAKDNYQFIPETIFHSEPMYQPDLFTFARMGTCKGGPQQSGCGQT